MKVIEGKFGKEEEEEVKQASASDTCQAMADMLSEMEDEEVFTEPECIVILAWKGVPALIGNNVEDLNRLSVLIDFAKADVLGAIAAQEAEETGIYGDEDDDTIH
jgi:hypothetical protein